MLFCESSRCGPVENSASSPPSRRDPTAVSPTAPRSRAGGIDQTDTGPTPARHRPDTGRFETAGALLLRIVPSNFDRYRWTSKVAAAPGSVARSPEAETCPARKPPTAKVSFSLNAISIGRSEPQGKIDGTQMGYDPDLGVGSNFLEGEISISYNQSVDISLDNWMQDGWVN